MRVDGEHYRVHGAKPGPAPAHDVEIWLGAYKPRMLRLTGAKADGWLPSMSYLDMDGVGELNARIDAAAVDAGRSPAEIRRLLNVDPGLEPERLAELTLEHGFGTFILSVSSDDGPARVRRGGRPAGARAGRRGPRRRGLPAEARGARRRSRSRSPRPRTPRA